MEEIWKHVVGYEGWYEVSSFGRVRRIKAAQRAVPGTIIKQQSGKQRGRLRVGLSINSTQHTFDVHRLVALAFIGPKPTGKEINHIDYNFKNNNVNNLEYVTKSENLLHAYKNGFVGGRGERQGNAKLTEYDVKMILKPAW